LEANQLIVLAHLICKTMLVNFSQPEVNRFTRDSAFEREIGTLNPFLLACMKKTTLENVKRFVCLSLLLSAVALLSACGGGAETIGLSGQNIALRTTAEPAGASCAAGGTKIEAGPDVNASGVLDDPEVNSTAYVCNGQSGLAGTAGTGLTGPIGPAGAPGTPGVAGAPGAVGATGATGPAGATGAAGPPGGGSSTTPGPTGPAGATGTTGAIGPSGPVGATGTTGAIGPTGPAGATGTAGITGNNGSAGQSSAIQVCVVPEGSDAQITNCGAIKGTSTLIQAGTSTKTPEIPDDPDGITSVVMLCGDGRSVSDPFLSDKTPVTCSKLKPG
jgi:Collagen triple helix repeat (20 copies)